MTDEGSKEREGNDEPIAKWLLERAVHNSAARTRLIERWARADTWTEVEGIALAWTIDPSILGFDGLMRTSPEQNLPEEARHYLQLASRSSDLSRNHITPSRFVAWAEAVGLAFHPDWHHAVAQAGHEVQRAMKRDADRRRERLISLWARSPYWSPPEGVALAFDLDPKEVEVRNAAGYDNPGIRGPAQARHLLDLAYRALKVGDLDDEIAPVAFMKWARSMRVEFHPDWWGSVAIDEARREEETEPSPPPTAASELGAREQDSLLKMVVGMAIGGYSWDRHAARSSATTDIADDLARAGVPLHADTIRKWLKKGADLLPGDSD